MQRSYVEQFVELRRFSNKGRGVTACPTCGRGADDLEQLLAETRIKLQDAMEAFLKEKRSSTALKNELNKQRKSSPKAAAARGRFDHYCQRFGKKASYAYDEKREKAALEMLKHFEEWELDEAIDGYALYPFVVPPGKRSRTGSPKQRHDGFSLIFRDADHVDSGRRLLEEHWQEIEAGWVRRLDEWWAKGTADVPTLHDDHSTVAPLRGTGRATDPEWRRLDPLARVLQALGDRDLRVTGHGAKFMAQCPAHDDRGPSLSIFERNDGAVLLNCFAGCQFDEVLGALGMEPQECFARDQERVAA